MGDPSGNAIGDAGADPAPAPPADPPADLTADAGDAAFLLDELVAPPPTPVSAAAPTEAVATEAGVTEASSDDAALSAAAAGAATPSVVINEIHYDPRNKAAGDEFIELVNISAAPINLTGWSVTKGIEYMLPPGTVLGAGAYLVIAQNPGALLRDYGVSALGPFTGKLSADGDEVLLRDRDGQTVDVVAYRLGFPWPTPDDNKDQSIGLLDVRLDNAQPAAWRSSTRTPGWANAVVAENPPPFVDAVEHTPFAPHSGDTIVVRAHVTDAEGVGSVRLWLQQVLPGSYIRITDSRYWTTWSSVAMQPAGNDMYVAQVPESLRRNRTLIRYRVEAVDNAGRSVTVPYADDPQPNFALYIYDGVPPWRGALLPNTGGSEGRNRDYDFNKMRSIPVYQLLAQEQDVADSQFIPNTTQTVGYYGNDYLWRGTFVVNGVVYDHIGFRARGGEYRYAVGKNHWKFDFTRGHDFQGYDDYGKPFGVKRKQLNFSAVIQHAPRRYRGEQGMFETMAYRLFNLAGVPASETNFVHFRVVDRWSETGNSQYEGDFWGLYLAIENMDGRFLAEHGLPDGNLYDMHNGTGDLDNQGDQGVTDKSDLNAFMNAYLRWTQDANWWRSYFDLDGYFKFRSVLEMVHHYDVDQGKNYYFFLDPVAGKWRVLPWDLDLTWAETMFGQGNEPFRDRVLAIPGFQVAYQNELRSLRDLLFNQEQVFPMLDETAAIIDTSSNGLSMVDADRLLWDYNPILVSWYVDSNRAAHGKYYEISPNRGFTGMVQLMKEYVTRRIAWIDGTLLTDRGYPNTPTAAYAGPAGYPTDQLVVRSSGYSDPQGPNTFAGMQWRAAEIIRPGLPGYVAGTRSRYEAEATWTSPVLRTFQGEIKVPNGACRPGVVCRVRVRMLDTSGRWSHWSAPVEFVAGAPKQAAIADLKLTEIMYRPAPSDWLPGSDLEFVELHNSGSTLLDLSGMRFTEGIEYTFPIGSQLAPGGYLVLAKSAKYFQQLYGVAPFGEYKRDLSNKGERIVLVSAYGQPIIDVTYSDTQPWPTDADGLGWSLVRAGDGDPNDPAGWRASTMANGSPGAEDPLPVQINEIAPDPVSGRIAQVELYNPAAQTANVGGWVLSTARTGLPGRWADVPAGYRLAAGTTVPAGGYLAVYVLDANPPMLMTSSTLALFSAAPGASLSGYVDRATLSVPPDGTSLGRIGTSDGFVHFAPQQAVSLGQPNGPALPAPLAISRIAFDAATGMQWVELTNVSGAPLPLFDASDFHRTWVLGGAALQLPAGITLPAGGKLALTSADPSQFCLSGSVAAGVRVVGPLPLRLGQQEGDLALLRPTAWQGGWTFAEVDSAHYRPNWPWPALAPGSALSRIDAQAFGSEPHNWVLEPALPPGAGVPGAELCSFDVHVNENGRTEVTWVMIPPNGAVAYRVLRSAFADPANRVVIETQRLAANDGVDAPALHSLIDQTAEPGQEYIYWLQAVAADDTVRELGFTTPRMRNNLAFAPFLRR